MLSMMEIIRKNDETFYANNNKRKIDTKPRILATGAFSIALSVVLDKSIQNLLEGAITVHSILIGFSFTVMFFLVSKEEVKLASNDTPHFIEHNIAAKRVNKLSKEIFYNISYFSIASIACVVTSVLLMIPNESDVVWRAVSKFPKDTLNTVVAWYGIAAYAGSAMVRSLFIFLMIEAIYTFYRTVRRVIFLFEEQIALRSIS